MYASVIVRERELMILYMKLYAISLDSTQLVVSVVAWLAPLIISVGFTGRRR